MPNDIKLQEGHPVDENLRPIKVGGKSTALEISQHGNGCRVNGSLGVTDDINCDNLSMTGTLTSSNLTIMDSSSITLAPSNDNAGNGMIFLTHEGNSGGAIYTSSLLTKLMGVATNNSIELESTGTGDIELDSNGDITISSHDGNFIMSKGGTEFSPANSSYSGMLLGCTHVFGSGTGGVFQIVGTAWESLLWDTDKYALVTFVVPPSNKVKISVHFPYIAASGIAFQLGLATDSSATTLDNKYANDVDDANRSDSFNINYSWVVEGSDHSWSAGETKTLYIMAYAAANIRFYTGGTNAGGYGGVIVEATALPATIGDGSEP